MLKLIDHWPAVPVVPPALTLSITINDHVPLVGEPVKLPRVFAPVKL